MIIGGLDIATTSGLTRCDGAEFRACSFRPSEKRPRGLERNEIDFEYEGRIFREWRDFLRSWFIGEGIEAVGVEKPLRSDVRYKKATLHTQADWNGPAITYEDVGGTTMSTVFRLYNMFGIAVELAARLNIYVHPFADNQWRAAFGVPTRAPRGTKDGRKWLKQRAKDRALLLGIDVRNDDQADSVGVAWATRQMLDPYSLQKPGELKLASG